MSEPLEACLAEIATRGAPTFRTRMRLMDSFGPYSRALDASGHRVRALLSLSCAERTLQFWQTRYGEDAVTAGLRACRPFLSGTLDADQFTRLFHAAYALAEDFPYETAGVDDSTLCAGFSVASAMAVCLTDDKPLDGDTENDVDVGDWDSAFLSAVAVAGGADWQDHALDVEARASFWSWWASEAVPEAVRLAGSRG